MKALISSYKTIIELNTHKTQIVRHRDINPKNIMVNADGVAFIIDFGQSKKSSPTSIMQSERTVLRGTAAYRPSFSYNEGVVLYRTIYDIAGWARIFISVAASEWLETPTRIPKLEPKSPKYYKLLKPFLEIDDNVNLDWQQNLEDIINNASNVLQDPEQLREF
ncbi:hypothetical protein TVAG_476230 [Trichomonas vaginalis G3]|uniref:Protein kinase domain-containing protein n=1 Tax=Trichomonas vaginalis (strain ATCC PRA-98 / G3) TaxID=412133 RepID=A2DA46_TRIV3|nr:protein kinase-like (PK-like) family [Trichomonas vaginalis G3]EAY22694.1 hypothetical protein TVAG_476230 [Trichomonas vaginalis G3]KAI5525507.1 protein kinase-like (PK-like) family [Trichomonas vaginalis G3]|eukprot:XP_001583680.1 hypothetical protein [Trichomonas vaginalis G3]